MAFNPEVFTQLSPPEMQLHWATATGAFLLGLLIFVRPKGTVPHKTMGAIYATLMLTTATAAFFIRNEPVSGWEYLTPKGMSFIHLFVPVTFYGIVAGLYGMLVKKDKNAHRGPLIGSFIGGMVIAGLLTFAPGRRMHATFFWDEMRVEKELERRQAESVSQSDQENG